MGRKKKTIIEEGVAPESTTEAEDVPAFGEPKEKKAKAKKTEYRVVLDNPGSFLNVRKEPGLDAPSIGKLKDGQVVSASGQEQDGWIRIETTEVKGYVLFSKLAVV